MLYCHTHFITWLLAGDLLKNGTKILILWVFLELFEKRNVWSVSLSLHCIAYCILALGARLCDITHKVVLANHVNVWIVLLYLSQWELSLKLICEYSWFHDFIFHYNFSNKVWSFIVKLCYDKLVYNMDSNCRVCGKGFPECIIF